MVLEKDEYVVCDDKITISKKALEECRDHYCKVADKFKPKPKKQDLDFRWPFYVGKADVCIDLLKKLDENGYIKCYCSYDSEDKYCEGKYHFIGKPTFKTHPATKEQRAQLEKEMADAGYIFDFEKKELNKIEQKPIDKSKFKVKYAGSEYNVFETKDIAGVTFYGIEDEPNHIDYVLPDNCEIVSEQKSAWSEEDDNCLSTIIAEFSKCAGKSVSKDEWMRCNDFLNSLKDRVQPKQEWSDVDKDILFRTIDSLKFLKDTISTDQNYAVNIIDIEREITWLKSLRPQNRWKPSDEQMEYLAKAITTLGNEGDNKTSAILYELRTDLKKLKE